MYPPVILAVTCYSVILCNINYLVTVILLLFKHFNDTINIWFTGSTEPLLLMPLYDDLDDHSEYSNTILYNESLVFPDDIIVDMPDPWYRRFAGTVDLRDELDLRVELPVSSPLRKLQSFTVVMW